MGKANIPLTEKNKKIILNFIGMCRLNGLEQGGQPSMSFKEMREEIGEVIFDLYYKDDKITPPCWNMTVKVDTDNRFHDDAASKKGEMYCYLDSYRIEEGSLEIRHNTSKFNIFAF